MTNSIKKINDTVGVGTFITSVIIWFWPLAFAFHIMPSNTWYSIPALLTTLLISVIGVVGTMVFLVYVLDKLGFNVHE